VLVAAAQDAVPTNFQQRFAQVTNPPIDSIREELVMSLVSLVGPRPNLFDLDSGGKHIRLELKQPILSKHGPGEDPPNRGTIRRARFRAYSLSICWPARKAAGMADAIERICKTAEKAVTDGHNIIILTDRPMDADQYRRAVAAGDRRGPPSPDPQRPAHRGGLVVETGEARQLQRFLPAGRLWRRGDQPLCRARHAVGAAPGHG